MEDNTKEINSIVKLEKHKIIVHIFVPFSLSQISWKISISSIVLLYCIYCRYVGTVYMPECTYRVRVVDMSPVI